jgi:hypothetical protein
MAGRPPYNQHLSVERRIAKKLAGKAFRIKHSKIRRNLLEKSMVKLTNKDNLFYKLVARQRTVNSAPVVMPSMDAQHRQHRYL